MDHLEELVRSVCDRFGQINSVRHVGDASERVDQCSIRTADGSSVCVNRFSVGVKGRSSGRRPDHS